MRLEMKQIVIRDLKRSDADHLYRIVHEKNIMRFMGDWSEGVHSPEDYFSYIDWHQTQKESTDVCKNKRYAIALKESDEMIGMEDTLNEVEVAYFMSEAYQRKGYTKEAVQALVNWIFTVSNLPYVILTIDAANDASYQLAQACGFECFEKRTPISHRQPNMESESYFYFRKYRM